MSGSKCSHIFILSKEVRKEMFYLMMHSKHFIYGYMASDIWLRTILIVRMETRCRHRGYSFRLTARVLLYAPSHKCVECIVKIKHFLPSYIPTAMRTVSKASVCVCPVAALYVTLSRPSDSFSMLIGTDCLINRVPSFSM